MVNKQTKVSIIIVHYKVKEELFSCLASINKLKPKVTFEIIIVDNDEKTVIKKSLLKKFPGVRYIKNSQNNGYSGGNNLGASVAQGEYLFFLNPDTAIVNTFDPLIFFLEKHKKTGIIAPLLLDMNNKPYPQGNKNLGFWEGIISLSILNKIFPNNSVSKKYFLSSWNQKSIQKVDVVPGTAFVIKKELFTKLKGFDEQFFLFFEEFDFCRKVKKAGYTLYITPKVKVKHVWGASTKQSSRNIDRIFQQSRFIYFKKYYGMFPAFFIELVNRINMYLFFLLMAVCIGALLRFDRLSLLMTFIGDQGWFYLSAKDLVTQGEIPLVGIPSSRPWLHQGPLWTYILAIGLWVFNFNPVGGAYLTAFIGVLTIVAMYYAGTSLFNKKVGSIAALLYATSPLIVMQDRMPYHTSPIAFFVILLLYSFHKLLQRKPLYFPIIITLFAILYNLEIATATLWFPASIIFIYLYFKDHALVKTLFTRNILFLCFLGFFTIMLPMLLHDISHGFLQTGKFLLWIPYRIFVFFNTSTPHGVSLTKGLHMIDYFIDNNRRLLSEISSISLLISLSSFFYLFRKILILKIKNAPSYYILFVFLFIPLLGVFFNLTPSEAYLPMLFPPMILAIALFFASLMQKKLLTFFVITFLLFMIFFNCYNLISNNFYVNEPFTLQGRIIAAKKIIDITHRQPYMLIGKGAGSEFASFTMNYAYLTWWLQPTPSHKKSSIQITIRETSRGIYVGKNK